MKAKNSKCNLNEKDYLDLWKHYEDAGGRDKDRMVTIVTWFLAFAIAILGYILKEGDFCPSSDKWQFILTLILESLGLAICCISLYFLYAYASYANFYWYAADKIMKEKIEGLSEYHNRVGFQKAIESNAESNFKKMSLDQSIIRCLIVDKRNKTSSTNQNDFETTKGLVGVFKGIRNIILFLFAGFVALLIFTILVKLNILHL